MYVYLCASMSASGVPGVTVVYEVSMNHTYIHMCMYIKTKIFD